MNAYRSPESYVRILFAGAVLAAIGLATPQSDPNDPTPTIALQTPSIGNADSNGSMIAVTGVDLTGSSILYLVDTERSQLAVYQANGGGSSTQSVKLVGARRIDLDLQLYGYNDKSEYKYEDLEQRFIENGLLADPNK